MPPTNAVLCLTCFALVTALSLYKQLPDHRHILVPLVSACSVILFLFGLHCHYHGTFGIYAIEPIARTANTSGPSSQLSHIPVLLFGAAFAFYGLSAMRLSGAETLSGSAVWRHSVFVSDAHELSARSVLLSVGWLVVFCAVRVMAVLVNSIGLGWLLWYMMANAIVLAMYLRWWLPNGADNEDVEAVQIDGTDQIFDLTCAADLNRQRIQVLVVPQKTALLV